MKFREISLYAPPFFMLALILMIVLCFLLFLVELLKKDDPKSLQMPLNTDTLQNLCNKLSLDTENQLCNGTSDVYASDFNETFNKQFLPKDETPAKFEDVEAIIGDYQDYCTPVENEPTSGYGYFRCDYDLNGQSYWMYFFYFYYPDNSLFRITAGAPDD
jgi:hypothetical protein